MGILGKLLDASVYFSFDQSGYRRHARDFADDLPDNLSGKRYAVTGANSGIGKAAALGLAARGAQVALLCRSPERGREAMAEIEASTGNAASALVLCDLADPASVRAAARKLQGRSLDGLVHNAGLMPTARETSAFGVEMTAAVHLAGPLLLTTLLRGELTGGRVVFVSSGGMYTQRLDLDLLDDSGEGEYDGMVAYARTKRAQVVLAEVLDHRMNASVHAMHPGWVDTPAVASAMPKFHRFTQGRLRTVEEGADTVVWLCGSPALDDAPGGFWFDRARRGTEKLPRTKTTPEARAALLPLVAGWAGVSADWAS